MDVHEGYWRRLPSVLPTRTATATLPGGRTLTVAPDVGTAAWIDCAGHLPWGLSTDQRLDDARSLTWDQPPPDGAVVGQPRLRIRVSADAPAASLSVKLCDVFPDGTSALVTRGTLDLAFRDGVHEAPRPLVPGEAYEVTLDLDACAYQLDPGHLLRVSVAGSDWPNTVAPPAPVRLTVHEVSLDLPLLEGEHPVPEFTAGAAHHGETLDDVAWEIRDDVLRQTTHARTHTVSEYDTPYAGRAREDYRGEVSVDRRTFEQRAHAETAFELGWPEADIEVRSVMDVVLTRAGLTVDIETRAVLDGVEVSRRAWHESHPS